MKLEKTVYSVSEDDGSIQICAVMNSSSLLDFDVTLCFNSTDEGLYHYYKNTEKF